jgi:hypothetical protein
MERSGNGFSESIMMQVSSPSPKYQQIRSGLLGGVDDGMAMNPRTRLVIEGVISNIVTEQLVCVGGGTTMGLHFLASHPP